MVNPPQRHYFKKRFGQNFFKSSYWPQKIVDLAEVSAQDTFLEIGPGAGALTEILLTRAKRVICFEIDNELIPKLHKRFDSEPKFELIHQDILQADLTILNLDKYKVIGSLPYNIAKKIIRLFLTNERTPESMTVVVQKEVAENYVAQAPKASFLSNLANTYAEIKLLATIPKSDFYPMPKVAGGVLQFTKIKSKFAKPEALIKFIKIAFQTPRKIIANNLHSVYPQKDQLLKIMTELDLSPTARASELKLDQWSKLYAALNS